MLSRNRNLVVLEKHEDPRRRCRGEVFELRGEEHLAKVIGAESVDVFFWVDRADHFGDMILEMVRKRKLDDEPGHIRISIQLCSDLQKLRKRGISLQVPVLASHPYFAATFDLLFDVAAAPRVIADLHHHKLRIELGNFWLEVA